MAEPKKVGPRRGSIAGYVGLATFPEGSFLAIAAGFAARTTGSSS